MIAAPNLLDPSSVLDDGTPATGYADYDALPRSIKDQHSLEGWLWLSGEQKAALVQTETEPEY